METLQSRGHNKNNDRRKQKERIEEGRPGHLGRWRAVKL